MKQFLTFTVFLALFLLSALFSVESAPDQGRDIEILEHVYFSIERMPTSRSDGRIKIYKDSDETSGACRDCELTLRFAVDLAIKISGETSTMSLEQLRLLPRQRVGVELKGDRLLSIGMVEVERGTRFLNDI